MAKKKQPPLEASLAYTRIGVEIARRTVQMRPDISTGEMQLLNQFSKELGQYHRLMNRIIRELENRQALTHPGEPIATDGP